MSAGVPGEGAGGVGQVRYTLHRELDQAPVLPVRVDGMAAEEHRVPTVSRLELGGSQQGQRAAAGREGGMGRVF